MRRGRDATFESVWDALADTAEEAENLRLRSEMMRKLAAIIEQKGWTQTEAANNCGVTQPRINDLLRGRISRFSLDALVNIAAALGQRVHVELNPRQRPGRRRGEAPGRLESCATRVLKAAGRRAPTPDRRRLPSRFCSLTPAHASPVPTQVASARLRRREWAPGAG